MNADIHKLKCRVYKITKENIWDLVDLIKHNVSNPLSVSFQDDGHLRFKGEDRAFGDYVVHLGDHWIRIFTPKQFKTYFG